MKIPEKSPNDADLLQKYPQKIGNLFMGYSGSTPDPNSEVIRDIVRKYNGIEYIHWDDLRRKELPYEPDLVWLLLKVLRRRDYNPIRIANITFIYIVLEKFQKQLHLIDKASPGSIDRLIGVGGNDADRAQYLISSLMEEAIASSQLEGAATTRVVAKKILREGKKPKNVSERMIVNNYKTIRKVRELKDLPLSKDLILNIHREITQGTLDEETDETQFRTTDDIVVRDKADYSKIYRYPPPSSDIPKMIDDLCKFANDDEGFVHPIIKAIILHFLIGYIHPFNDGNGRSARAIFYWYVLKNQYDLFEYLSISRIFVNAPAKYTKAYLYSETDENDITYFIDFNIEIINKAMEDLRQYIERKHREERDALKLVDQIQNISFRQAEILKDAVKHPDRRYTVSEVSGKYKISLQTARADLLYLEQLDKIKKIKSGNAYLFILKKGEEI